MCGGTETCSGSSCIRTVRILPTQSLPVPRCSLAYHATAPCPLHTDGDVRLWVEMALVQPAADPTQQPQLDSFFCMAMVIQGPAQGFYPGSLRAAWAEEEREEEEGDKGSGPGATHDAGDLTPRRAPPDDDLLWLVSRCRAAEGPPGMEPAGTAPHISTLTRVHVVRALQAVVVSSWRAEEGPSSAGPGAVTSAQAVLWGQLEQRRPRGAHHMDSPPSLTCRLEAREGSSTILVLESAAAAPPAVPRPEARAGIRGGWVCTWKESASGRFAVTS